MKGGGREGARDEERRGDVGDKEGVMALHLKVNHWKHLNIFITMNKNTILSYFIKP